MRGGGQAATWGEDRQTEGGGWQAQPGERTDRLREEVGRQGLP